MLRRPTVAVAVAVALAAMQQARAQETLDDIDKGQKAKEVGDTPPAASETPAATGTEAASGNAKASAEVNGYVDDRFDYSLISPGGTPVSTRDVPSVHDLAEANVQLKVTLTPRLFAYMDLSLFYQTGGVYYDLDSHGNTVSVAEHDVPSLRPLVVPSELYVSYQPVPWFNLLVGRKRIVWGSGVAFNPTDLINPPKDPTDPTFQRSGNWLARVDMPFEKFTVTGLFAPGVLYQQNGIPYALMAYPSYPPAETVAEQSHYGSNFLYPDPRDKTNEQHFLAALRSYWLVYNSDINLIYYFSNLYSDQFQDKSRLGVSFSRYFFTDHELHFEALLQTGSSTMYPNHLCVVNPLECAATGTPFLSASRLNDGDVHPHLLAGWRTMLADETSISIEYYYQADGYSDDQFADVVQLMGLARARGISTAGLLSGNASPIQNGALPTRFAFNPLRRHYLIASYSKPRIHDDWTINAVLIAGLRDLSGMFTPSVTWTPLEWLNLSLFGFIPVRGLGVGEAEVKNPITGATASYSEYSLLPFDFRVLLEARAFY